MVSCEQEFVFVFVDLFQEIVVEGYIEVGVELCLLFVIFLWFINFFFEFSVEDFNDNFVSGVDVCIIDGQDIV